MENKKKCEYEFCAKYFKPKRSWAKFCCQDCKMKDFWQKKIQKDWRKK